MINVYTVPFFVSGQTYKISKGSNNYSLHCICCDMLITHAVALMHPYTITEADFCTFHW